jgi:hypothetical protein
MSFVHSTGRGVRKLSELFCWIGVAGLITLVAGAARTAKLEAPPAVHEPLLAGAEIPSQVLSSVQRACQNCHSENTAWPWYSGIPPLSWQIHKDVAQARQFMDLSKWDDYTEGEKRGFLVSMAAALKTRAMPPTRYVWMHPEARLSDAELVSLENWALAERQRIRPGDTAPSKPRKDVDPD